jgi:quercetin dioxygenase-like cupin family protein
VDTWDINSLDVQPHQPQVLRSDREARVIAINLPSGEQLKEHRVHERAYLFVAEGEIELTSDGGSQTGGAGFLAHFEAQQDHEVTAKSDARIVLVLAPWPGEGHPSQRSAGGSPA